MKKIIVTALFAVLATASFASATTTWTNQIPDGGTAPVPSVTGTLSDGVVGSTVFQVSTNVTLIGAGNEGGYNCTSKHISGDKTYLSSSVSASIEEDETLKKGEALTALVVSGITENVYTGAGGY